MWVFYCFFYPDHKSRKEQCINLNLNIYSVLPFYSHCINSTYFQGFWDVVFVNANFVFRFGLNPNAKYRGLLPYANFITSIFPKNSINLPYANFGLFYFISAVFWAKITLMK